MAGTDHFIQLPTDGSGKKVRGWWNTVGANDVYAQAMVPTDIDGVVQTSATGIWVGGHLAHDAVDAGNPIKIGGQARASTPTTVAGADRVDAWFDRYGALVTTIGALTTGGDSVSNGQLVYAHSPNNQFGPLFVANAVYNPGSTSWDRQRGSAQGTWVDGNVVHDAADAGNPIKIGGRGVSGTPTSVANNDRTDAWFDQYGSQSVHAGTAVTGADGLSNSALQKLGNAGGWGATTPLPVVVGNYNYNGSSWDRQRGDITGLFVQGHLAHDAVDAGNPIKIGGKASTATPSAVANADRVNAWFDPVGSQSVFAATGTTNADGQANTFHSQLTQVAAAYGPLVISNLVFNGTTWDRMRGSTLGTFVIGAVAHDAVDDASGPLKIGGKVQSGLGAGVATADRVNAWFTAYGQLATVVGDSITPGDAYTNSDHVRPYGPTGLSGPLNVSLMGFNGTTWDRVRTANTGRLQVDVITAPASGGGSQYVENVASAGGETMTLAGAIRQDTPASTNADGDYANLKTDSTGKLWVNVGTPAVTVSSGAITVSGSVTADTELPTAAALADGAAATPTVPTIGTIGLVYNGTTVDRQRGTAAGGTWIQGPAAHDATIAGSPVTTGGRSSHAIPTDVSADGEAVWSWLLRSGAQMVAQAPHLPMVGTPYTLVNKTVQQTTTQAGTDVWTPASGKKICITSYQIQAGGTTAASVALWFGANADTTYTRGTDYAIFDGEFAPSATLKPGVVQTGLWISPTADYEIHLTTSAGITITITLWGYEF